MELEQIPGAVIMALVALFIGAGTWAMAKDARSDDKSLKMMIPLTSLMQLAVLTVNFATLRGCLG